jgi:hypothetical protein
MSYGREVKETGQFSSLFVVAFIVIAVGVTAVSYVLYREFAPLNEQVRYNTYKESQAYNDGMTTDLTELKRSYDAANPDQQAALKGTINARFATYDATRLPPELGAFLRQVRGF